MRILILAAVAAFAFTSVADAKPCKDATGKFVKCPAAAAAPAATAKAATPMASPAVKAPRNCVKGKACGNSCIKATDICHKPA
ncbi:MAG: hypothetical protein ABI306_07220 [Caulobacteraceae bacterium]